MPDNPFQDRPQGNKVRTTLADLEQRVRDYNQALWVKESGKHYFINRRTDEKGEIVHFLDRNG